MARMLLGMTDHSSRGLWYKLMLGAIIVVPSLVLVLGWGAGIDRFTRFAPGLAAMVPTTAASFIILASALLLPAKWKTLQFRMASLVVAAVALADLITILSGTANGIDALFISQLVDRPHDKMSAGTAICFLLAAACIFLLTGFKALAKDIYVAIATLGLILCSIALIGYLFDISALYDVFVFSAMALHTAALFAVLFIALMLSYNRGWIWILLGEGAGSDGARRLFPFVVAGPLVLCLLALGASREDYFSAEFRIMLLAAAMTIIGLAAILRNAAIENRTERQLTSALDRLKVALADKDLLIREIHHRVKNNLQQINALIAIDSSRHHNVEVRESFQEMSGRVQALGLVHQLLMQSPRPSEIDIAPFLEELGRNIAKSHGLARREIALEVDTQSEQVHLDAAISIGLLINELVVNAIKHAFAERERGQISIQYRTSPDDGQEREIAVSDDGCGANDLEALLVREDSGGMRIIRSLVAQLQGNMTVDLNNGTHIRIRFPERIYEESRYAG